MCDGIDLRKRNACQRLWCLILSGLLAWSGLVSASGVGIAQEADLRAIDFNRQVRPILSNKCFACHGPDAAAREADLRLDDRAGALEDLGGYAAIVPGDPESSEIIERVSSEDRYEVMPPPQHGKPLTSSEIEVLRKWIAEGAEYSPHWAYVAPADPQVPQINSPWIRNDVDRFVLSQMEQHQLQPSQAAERLDLIRRLSLDLTGLPPTVEAADRFAADGDADAYERLVDQLLADPAFGERWASVWLDLARYADSAGFAEDRPRTIWAYRDYVIRSLNSNKPFDEFTIEQLAGDLLAEPTTEQRIATAFHRNTLTNSEGGTDDEEFRNAAVVDRVNTTMAVWMGTTMACAQCHDHKYDPLSQREYFELFDFFNHTADNDRPDERPTLEVYSEADQNRREQLVQSIEELNEAIAEFGDGLQASTVRQELQALPVPAPVEGRWVRIELPGKNRILSLAEVQVFADGENLALAGSATQSSTEYNAPAKLAIDGNTDGQFEQKSVTHSANEENPWWELDLGRARPVETIKIWNRAGANLYTRLNGCRVTILDESKKPVWVQDLGDAVRGERSIEVLDPPVRLLELVQNDEADWTAEQRQFAKDYYLSRQPRWQELQRQLAAANAELRSIRPMTTVPVMERGTNRTTHLQIRGDFQQRGATVSAATPGVFPALSDSMPRDRMALARWLVSEDNPLTARVQVNRIWEQLFGRGLVLTSEEFGNQGDPPTHPQLLDYLAMEYMRSGWDTKALIKKIVMSATYRQSSRVDERGLQQDPGNRWLSRGPRLRLTAEMVRDQALAVSGLLSRKMFGEPVNPPQPKFGLKAAFSGSVDWQDAVGPDRYRRAIYTRWRRSAPYPSLATFDMGSREVCEIRRSMTNTPLQALVTLNDPVYVEAAQALARRVMDAEPDGNSTVWRRPDLPESRLRRMWAEDAFRHCLIRRPNEQEIERVVELFERAREHFAQDPEAANQLGIDPLNPPCAGTDTIELAAWTTVANVLLNLDEVFQKR